MKKWELDKTLGLIFILTIISLVILFFFQQAKLAMAIFGSLTVLTSSFGYLKERNEKVYLLFSKWVSKLKNKQLEIEWKGRFKGDFKPESLAKSKKFLKDNFDGKIKIETDNKLVVDIPKGSQRLILELFSTKHWGAGFPSKKGVYDKVRKGDEVIDIDSSDLAQELQNLDNSQEKLLVVDGKLNISFRAAEEMLETTITPLVESIKEEYNSEWKFGSFSIKLSEENPYWGALLKRCSPEEISNFEVSMIQEKPNGKKDVVRITKDNLNINAETLTGFIHLAKEYLGLGVGLKG